MASYLLTYTCLQLGDYLFNIYALASEICATGLVSLITFANYTVKKLCSEEGGLL